MGGVPKGLEQVGDARIIDRVAMSLREVTPDLLLVANHPDADSWMKGVPVVADLHAGVGGLAGVEAALGRGRDALVVAWDMPFVTGALLQALLAAARDSDADVVLPESDSPHGSEPFCAFYSVRLRDSLTRFLDGGGGPAHEFLARLSRVRRLTSAEIGRIGDARRLFLSINTPADLERARAMAADSE